MLYQRRFEPQGGHIYLMKIDAKEFEEKTGRKPEDDDLERVNCTMVGRMGHSSCGWCYEHSRPRYECWCSIKTGSHRLH